METAARAKPELIRAACLAALALVIAGYQSAAAFYQGYRIPQGNAMNHLLPAELAHYALYAAFGLTAAAFLYRAVRGLSLCDRLAGLVRTLGERPTVLLPAAAALVLAVSWGLAHFVLGHEVTTDDEHTYRFIARTIREGGLTAPSPGGDLGFFLEQFVVINERVRFGKYPIGHPLLLALGQSAGLEPLVVPLLTALAVFPLYLLAARLFDRRVAALACLLYAVSPQVWFTGATYLSQPASALMLAAALALLTAHEPGEAPALWKIAAAGACLGFGVLVRPLPGVLFAAVAGADVVFRPGPWSARVRRALAFGVPLAVLSAGILAVNHAQTGAALVSGYEAFHAPGEGIGAVMRGDGPVWAMSVASTVVRANFWLLGWPLSLGACLLAGRLPRPWLLWGVLAAELVYRLAAPKAGVGGAGPLYLFEAVPVLCLLAARGIARLARGETVLASRRDGPATASAAVVSLAVVALVLFLPPKLADLGRMGVGQREVHRLIAKHGVHSALVFHEGVVPPWTGLSWAYYPRCNGPRLDDDVLFVNFPPQDGFALGLDFQRRRYPGRSAWYFGWEERTGSYLVPLEEYARMRAARSGAAAPAAVRP